MKYKSTETQSFEEFSSCLFIRKRINFTSWTFQDNFEMKKKLFEKFNLKINEDNDEDLIYFVSKEMRKGNIDYIIYMIYQKSNLSKFYETFEDFDETFRASNTYDAEKLIQTFLNVVVYCRNYSFGDDFMLKIRKASRSNKKKVQNSMIMTLSSYLLISILKLKSKIF